VSRSPECGEGEAKQSHQSTLLNLTDREWTVAHNVRNLTCALISAISIEKGKEVGHGKDASLVMLLGVSWSELSASVNRRRVSEMSNRMCWRRAVGSPELFVVR
jgi:hypothetical protein